MTLNNLPSGAVLREGMLLVLAVATLTANVPDRSRRRCAVGLASSTVAVALLRMLENDTKQKEKSSCTTMKTTATATGVEEQLVSCLYRPLKNALSSSSCHVY